MIKKKKNTQTAKGQDRSIILLATNYFACICLVLLPSGCFFFFLSHLSFSLRFLYANYQFSSVAQSCPTLCNPMNRSTPGLPVHHQLPEFTQTHVHRAKKTSASRHLSWEHIDFETVSKNVGLKKTAQKDIAASGHSLILKRYQDP